MLLATFNSSTDWAGKTIAFDDGVFMVEGLGELTADEVMLFDADGQLTWASPEQREVAAGSVREQSASDAGAPPAEPRTAAPEAGAVQPGRLEQSASSSAPVPDSGPCPVPTREAVATPAGSMLIAVFGPTIRWAAGKTISFEDDAFVLEGYGPISAADLMEYDRQGHLSWESAGKRAVVESRALKTPAAPGAAPVQMEQVTDGASGSVVDAAAAVSSASQPAGVKRAGAPEGAVLPLPAPPALAAPAQPPRTAVAAPPQTTPLESDPLTRERLDKARQQYEKGKYKAAVETLWLLDVRAREGDAEAARVIVDLAASIREHVGGKLGEECTALIERSTKAMQLAADSGGSPRLTPTPAAEPNGGLLIAGWVVVVVGIVLIIGNITGAAPTFAYAGFLTTLVGGLMVGAGRGAGS